MGHMSHLEVEVHEVGSLTGSCQPDVRGQGHHVICTHLYLVGTYMVTMVNWVTRYRTSIC